VKIEEIKKSHKRNLFDCGIKELNLYLSKTARQHHEKGISKTFVLIDELIQNEIIAYFTLLVCEVKPVSSVKTFKNYPHLLPVLKLARFAVDLNFQKKGYAKLLIANVIHKAILISQQVGIIGITIDAKNEDVALVYRKYGFISLGDELILFMPISVCLQLKI